MVEATNDPLLVAAAAALGQALRSLLASRADPGEYVFVVHNATVEPGRGVLLASLQQGGMSVDEAGVEAARRADAARDASVPLAALAVHKASDLSRALHAATALVAWLGKPCPADHIRVITNEGTQWLPYLVPMKWTPPPPQGQPAS